MNWTALGVSLSALVVSVGFVVFVADLRSNLKTLTDVVREVRDEMKRSNRETHDRLEEHSDRLGEHDVVLSNVRLLLDLDDAAQSVVRESRRSSRRQRLRRAQDQVNQDVRDMMQHDADQERA